MRLTQIIILFAWALIILERTCNRMRWTEFEKSDWVFYTFEFIPVHFPSPQRTFSVVFFPTWYLNSQSYWLKSNNNNRKMNRASATQFHDWHKSVIVNGKWYQFPHERKSIFHSIEVGLHMVYNHLWCHVSCSLCFIRHWKVSSVENTYIHEQ